MCLIEVYKEYSLYMCIIHKYYTCIFYNNIYLNHCIIKIYNFTFVLWF